MASWKCGWDLFQETNGKSYVTSLSSTRLEPLKLGAHLQRHLAFLPRASISISQHCILFVLEEQKYLE
jgi:hypothetical protein